MKKLQAAINEAKKLNEGIDADLEALVAKYKWTQVITVLADHLLLKGKKNAADLVKQAIDFV